MRDHNAPGRMVGRHLTQLRGNVLIGKAMEAIASHALVIEVAREREGIVDVGVGAVECRVKAGDLGDARPSRLRRSDPGQIVRLMQRRQRHERL